jgi:hypothetical protein
MTLLVGGVCYGLDGSVEAIARWSGSDEEVSRFAHANGARLQSGDDKIRRADDSALVEVYPRRDA